MQNPRVASIGASVSEPLSTFTKYSGGLSDNDVTEFMVSPYAAPCASTVVTMDTPVAHRPDAFRKFSGVISVAILSSLFVKDWVAILSGRAIERKALGGSHTVVYYDFSAREFT